MIEVHDTRSWSLCQSDKDYERGTWREELVPVSIRLCLKERFKPTEEELLHAMREVPGRWGWYYPCKIKTTVRGA
jgi:hypothetical protein